MQCRFSSNISWSRNDITISGQQSISGFRYYSVKVGEKGRGEEGGRERVGR